MSEEEVHGITVEDVIESIHYSGDPIFSRDTRIDGIVEKVLEIHEEEFEKEFDLENYDDALQFIAENIVKINEFVADHVTDDLDEDNEFNIVIKNFKIIDNDDTECPMYYIPAGNLLVRMDCAEAEVAIIKDNERIEKLEELIAENRKLGAYLYALTLWENTPKDKIIKIYSDP